MKLTINCLFVLLLGHNMMAQKEYSNDVLVLHSGKVMTGSLYAHPKPDSVLMLGIGKQSPEAIAKIDIVRSITENVFWKPYSPNLKWTKAFVEKSNAEASKTYIRQSFLLTKGKEYRGAVITETNDEIMLKSSYTEREIIVKRYSFVKRRNEVVFQSDILLDKLPNRPKIDIVTLPGETLAESPVRPSNGFLGVHFGIAIPTGSFSESTFNMQFSNDNPKNLISNARVGTELSLNGIFLFQPGARLGVGVIGQFNRNWTSLNESIYYETNLVAMGMAAALPLTPNKISFLDIRCMGGVAAFSASGPLKVIFGQSQEAFIAYEQGYGPAFVADAGLRFMLHKRIELAFRIGHSVAMIDNIQTINNTGGSNSPLVNYQKLNKVNSSNVTLSVGLGIGL